MMLVVRRKSRAKEEVRRDTSVFSGQSIIPRYYTVSTVQYHRPMQTILFAQHVSWLGTVNDHIGYDI
jgi:hypothetical protein